MGERYPFKRYPKIYRLQYVPEILNYPLEVYEKLDGANTQIRKIKGVLLCGSRSGYLSDKNLDAKPWFRIFWEWVYTNPSLYKLPEDIIVYGEFLYPHTLRYYPQWTNQFFLIDVYDLEKERFIPYQDAVKLIKKIGLEKIHIIPLLYKGYLTMDKINELLKGSDYRDGDKEGIVLKNYEHQLFAKVRNI